MPFLPLRRARLLAAGVPLFVLLACNPGADATTTPGASTAVVSVAPTATSRPVPTQTATPAPTPTAVPTTSPTTGAPITPAAQKALDAYAKAVAAKDASFHIDQRASVTLDGTPALAATYALDVSGRDIAAVLDAGGVSLEIVALGDKAWLKQGAGDWQTGDAEGLDSILTEVIDVFRYGGDPADLVFMESGSQAGRTTHRFRAAGPLPYQTGAMKDAGTVGSVTSYELVIDDTGVPLTIEMTTTADALMGGQTRRAETQSSVEISRFGDKIKITAPI